MLGDNLPSGFLSGTETRILAAAGFDADMLTLGNNVTVKGLILEDIAGRSGNVVTVASRAAGDRVSASMVECEIRNPKAGGIVASGPIGRAIAVFTRNPGSPHAESALSLNVRRSIVRSTSGGDAVFGNNFAGAEQNHPHSHGEPHRWRVYGHRGSEPADSGDGLGPVGVIAAEPILGDRQPGHDRLAYPRRQ